MITLGTTSVDISSSGTTQTVAITLDAADDGLIVTLGGWECAGGALTLSSVTYNGAAMTIDATSNLDQGGCGLHTAIASLANPDTGSSYNVVVTWSGSMGGVDGRIIPLRGYKQTGAFDTSAAHSTSLCSDPVTTSVTVAENDEWIFDSIYPGSTAPGAVGANQTEINTDRSSYYPDAASGSRAMTWAFTGCEDGLHIVAAYKKEPAAAGNTTNFFQLL